MISDKKYIAVLIAIVVALFAAATAVMAFREGYEDAALREGSASSDESESVPFGGDGMPERASLEGEYVECLPLHDNFSEKVCIPGMRMDDGSYYAVNFMMMSQAMDGPPAAGQRFSANGVITPVEALSAEQWRHVIAKGIFSVTDGVRKL